MKLEIWLGEYSSPSTLTQASPFFAPTRSNGTRSANALVDLSLKRRPINRFIANTRRHILKTGEIKSCFGRVRRLPQVESPLDEKKAEAQRQGLNALIQGTASDLTQLALIRVHKFLLPYKSRFLFTVHDAIVMEIHETEMHLIDEIKEIMEQNVEGFDFPLEADVDIFNNRWGND